MRESQGNIPYDKFFGLSSKAVARYGKIFSLPVGLEPYAYLCQTYSNSYAGGRVLDFGCGAEKRLQHHLKISDDFYHSCDDDSSGTFTYRSVSEIPADQLYQVIAANQVFEHLSFDDSLAIAIKLAGHVAPGGIFQIGVPNPQHPNRQLCNPTHITPWNYTNLYAFLELGGLDPFYIARCNKFSGPRWYERPIISIVCRVFRMDWCDTVYAVGRRDA